MGIKIKKSHIKEVQLTSIVVQATAEAYLVTVIENPLNKPMRIISEMINRINTLHYLTYSLTLLMSSNQPSGHIFSLLHFIIDTKNRIGK